MAELDARRAEILGNAARKIQRRIRTYIARKDFIALREAAIQLQALCRCNLPSFLEMFSFSGSVVNFSFINKGFTLIVYFHALHEALTNEVFILQRLKKKSLLFFHSDSD